MASRRPGRPSVPQQERHASAADVLTRHALDSVARMTGRADLRLGITDVAPVVSCGDFSARAVVGEHLPITATVFREGHDAVAANVVWSPPGDDSTPPLIPLATWHHAVEVKIAAGQGADELANDLEEGARLLDRVAAEADDEHRDRVAAAAAALRDTSQELTV